MARRGNVDVCDVDGDLELRDKSGHREIGVEGIRLLAIFADFFRKILTGHEDTFIHRRFRQNRFRGPSRRSRQSSKA